MQSAREVLFLGCGQVFIWQSRAATDLVTGKSAELSCVGANVVGIGTVML
jgi:hypothetical protein